MSSNIRFTIPTTYKFKERIEADAKTTYGQEESILGNSRNNERLNHLLDLEDISKLSKYSNSKFPSWVPESLAVEVIQEFSLDGRNRKYRHQVRDYLRCSRLQREGLQSQFRFKSPRSRTSRTIRTTTRVFEQREVDSWHQWQGQGEGEERGQGRRRMQQQQQQQFNRYSTGSRARATTRPTGNYKEEQAGNGTLTKLIFSAEDSFKEVDCSSLCSTSGRSYESEGEESFDEEKTVFAIVDHITQEIELDIDFDLEEVVRDLMSRSEEGLCLKEVGEIFGVEGEGATPAMKACFSTYARLINLK